MMKSLFNPSHTNLILLNRKKQLSRRNNWIGPPVVELRGHSRQCWRGIGNGQGVIRKRWKRRMPSIGSSPWKRSTIPSWRMRPGPWSRAQRMQKSSNLAGFSAPKITAFTKHDSAQKASPSDGGKTTMKLSPQSPSAPLFEPSLPSSLAARRPKSIRWMLTLYFSIVSLMK